MLPSQISILDAEEVPYDFHARYSAKSKVYDYYILVSHVRRPLKKDRAWLQSPGLDLDSMRDAASRLIGKHDFACFQSPDHRLKPRSETCWRPR